MTELLTYFLSLFLKNLFSLFLKSLSFSRFLFFFLSLFLFLSIFFPLFFSLPLFFSISFSSSKVSPFFQKYHSLHILVSIFSSLHFRLSLKMILFLLFKSSFHFFPLSLSIVLFSLPLFLNTYLFSILPSQS